MEADEDKFLLFTENVNTIYVIQQIVLLVLLVRQTVLLVRQIVLLIKKTVLLARQTQLLVLLVRQIVWVKISTTPGGPPYATRANNISIFYYIQPSLVLCRKLFLQKFFVQLMSNSLRWQKCYLLYFSCSPFQVELEHCTVPLNFLPSFVDHLVDQLVYTTCEPYTGRSLFWGLSVSVSNLRDDVP